jgi:glycosyltransferase involved in cell wall biosynthesis
MLAARMARVKKKYSLIAGSGYLFSETKTITHKIVLTIACWLCRRGLRLADTVFFQNEDDLNLFLKRNLVKQQKTILTGATGIDISLYKAAKPNTNPITFILVARLLVEKGIREYAEAARAVKKKYTNTHFILLGGLDPNPSGLREEEVLSWVNEGVLEWPGEVDDVVQRLSNASVFVLPSYYREGIPRSTQEALGVGLPVITCDSVGCRETVIEGKTGFLVEPKNPEALASAMIYFIENPEEMTRMGIAGRKLAEEKFNVHKINKKILQTMGLQ